MRKINFNLRIILSFVLAGLLIVLAVAVGYVVANAIFYLLCVGLSYVVGGAVAGVMFAILNYMTTMAMLVSVWYAFLTPFITRVANSIYMFEVKGAALAIKAITLDAFSKAKSFVLSVPTKVKGLFSRKSSISNAVIVA